MNTRGRGFSGKSRAGNVSKSGVWKGKVKHEIIFGNTFTGHILNLCMSLFIINSNVFFIHSLLCSFSQLYRFVVKIFDFLCRYFFLSIYLLFFFRLKDVSICGNVYKQFLHGL